MIDPNHPFYAPLWRRLLIVAVCFVWAGVEFYSGEPFWGIIVGGVGIYATYKLFLEKRSAPAEKPSEEPRD